MKKDLARLLLPELDLFSLVDGFLISSVFGQVLVSIVVSLVKFNVEDSPA